MHKFLRAAGFSMYTKKKDIEKLLDLLERQPSMTKCVQVDEDSNVCEMRTEVAPGLGISIVGELNDDGDFEREFYFPYLESNIVGSTEECSVQRHTEKETYSGMVDENKVGITLIFYIQNFLEFREKMLDKEDGRYECSAEHADEEDAEGTVRRTYHVVVKELATGAVFEDTESVEIGRKDPVEIKTEDMTTVMLEGRKKWMMVQSVPDVSGRYAMNCDKGIEKIYYVSDDGDLTCAEDSFQLQAGEKYTFLIKLQ